MNAVVEIKKEALIALLNSLERPRIVDTVYRTVDGKLRLVLVREDGKEELFKGLRAA